MLQVAFQRDGLIKLFPWYGKPTLSFIKHIEINNNNIKNSGGILI